METSFERLGSTPSHEEWRPPQGDPTEQLLYQGAKMPEECKPEESLCPEKWSARSGSIPTEDKVFLPFFTLKSGDKDAFHSCALLNLRLVQSFAAEFL